ncbi:uncharacterized protein Dlip2 [Chironomus tepperi]|uniref:uncharacterized protein Dlip2 n=1 Tax=Chironomus tepperi TaxID=113505 RepID=UPI00391FA5C4
MAQSRKMCLFKGCDNRPGRTLFRFPTEKERFCVWAQNAGLELKGDVNVNEYRYLCDKHFSSKYVSNQSRRKMLVHTAVPEKWNEEIADTELDFNVVGEPSEKKRKSQFQSRETFDNQITAQPAIILNNQKIKLDESVTSNEETIEMIDSDGNAGSNHDIVYEEVIIPPPKRSYKCVVVKQKKPKSPVKTIMNYIQPTASLEPKQEETFFLTEEGNISSTNVEQKEVEEPPAPSTYKKSSSPVESYSEFIFNGEIYVQMPKRVFESEKEKIRGESAKYKAMLLKLRKQIDELLEN